MGSSSNWGGILRWTSIPSRGSKALKLLNAIETRISSSTDASGKSPPDFYLYDGWWSVLVGCQGQHILALIGLATTGPCSNLKVQKS